MIRKANINDCKVLNNLLTKLIRDERNMIQISMKI